MFTRKSFAQTPLVVLLIASLSTNWVRPYLCLGPIDYVGMALGLVLAIAGVAWFFAFDGHRGTKLKVIIVMNVLIAVMSFIAGIFSLAPFLNAELDFGPEMTVMGTIHEIEYESTSRHSRPSRTVTTMVNGRVREASFTGRSFWDVAAVRNGGPVRLTVRPGFFGIPWIEKFSDP
ncbi:hypothetical protein MBOU_20800 [Mycobacterium bourgelatii]|uniref:DUF4131 domain-containing protein n=2 Tax=Mycobacterium bourgelatii TaxID=1273442 RepID=A0A7I9YN40_MYCBU|nr:hypothetical protein MBOU_20800 [Mycobacterium bourgelatii]